MLWVKINIKTKIILLVFISGIFSGLGCEPHGLWILPWFTIVPLWLAVRKNNSWQDNAIIGLAWGLGYHGLTLHWITGIHPMTWLGIPWLYSLLIALFCWLFISLWGASLVVLWCLAMTFFLQNIPVLKNLQILSKVLVGIALWTGLEALYSLGPLWWSSLSLTQSPHNLYILQLGTISGPTTITALLLGINGLIAESINTHPNDKKTSQLLLSLAVASFCFFWLLGLGIYQRPLSLEKPINIGLIQGNISNEIKLFPAGFRKAIEGYSKGYYQLAQDGAQLVITPETALPFFWDDLVDHSSFYQAILQEKIPVLIGGFGRLGQGYTNSLFMVNSNGKVMGKYDKSKLVPLGEYVPFENILGKFIQRLSPLKSHLIAGSNEQFVDSPFGRMILGICYESAYPEIFRKQTRAGGEYIVTASNDAHYKAAMPAQHQAQDVMRAIENDRWAARITNTGYSSIINPRGETKWLSALNQYSIHREKIYRQNSQTLYVRLGDWLTIFFLSLAGVSWLKLFNPKDKTEQKDR